MVQYSAETEQIARAYNITPEETILSFAIASGAPLADAYKIITRQKAATTIQQCETECKQLLTNKPGIKILIHRIKNKQNPHTLKKQDQQQIQHNQNGNTNELSEEEKNELKTRSGLIEKIIDNISLTSGKDAISGLQTLAKLQGYDKLDETTEEERRKYFLPWVSNCRFCELMKVYKQVTEADRSK